jgi:hypothetical protein
MKTFAIVRPSFHLASVMFLAMVLSSCGTSGPVYNTSSTAPRPQPEPVRSSPATKYPTDNNHYRATVPGEGPSLVSAREKAMIAAKSELASLIGSEVQSISEMYIENINDNGGTESATQFEKLTRIIVDQKIKDYKTINEEYYKEKNTYTYWITLEMARKSVFEILDQELSKDQSLNDIYDRTKFEQYFDKN